MGQVRGGHLVAGFAVLHVLCCGLPLLIVSGGLGGTGALTSSPVLLGAGAVVLLVVAALGVRRMRAGGSAGAESCCLPDQQTGRPAAASPVRSMVGGER